MYWLFRDEKEIRMNLNSPLSTLNTKNTPKG